MQWLFELDKDTEYEVEWNTNEGHAWKSAKFYGVVEWWDNTTLKTGALFVFQGIPQSSFPMSWIFTHQHSVRKKV
jgi:hypothetical protein